MIRVLNIFLKFYVQNLYTGKEKRGKLQLFSNSVNGIAYFLPHLQEEL